MTFVTIASGISCTPHTGSSRTCRAASSSDSSRCRSHARPSCGLLYAIALLVSLLITGRLSDHFGRRPVISAAIVLVIASMLFFIVATSVVVLAMARILQGLATGLAVGALSATLVELADDERAPIAPVVASAAPNLGLAVGSMGASVLVQYAPAPFRLIYWVLLAGLMLGGLLVVWMRETGERRPGWLASLKPNVGVSAEARPTFIKVIPLLVALWALAGFYLALGPSLTGEIVGSSNLLWGGAVIFALQGSATASAILGKGSSPRTAMLNGCVGLFAGVGLTFAGIAASSTALFLVGSVIAGLGLGLTWGGAFRAVSAVTPPAEKAGTVAAIYVVSYLAFSVPIVIAGVATTHWNAHDVALVFLAVDAVLAALGTIAGMPSRQHHPATGGAVAPMPCPGTVPPYVEPNVAVT